MKHRGMKEVSNGERKEQEERKERKRRAEEMKERKERGVSEWERKIWTAKRDRVSGEDPNCVARTELVLLLLGHGHDLRVGRARYLSYWYSGK